MIDYKILIDIARGAGEEVLNFYHNPNCLDVTIKEDGSPLTMADQASHNFISQNLKKYYEWPILSEEDPVDYSIRKRWDIYWLIDPLDGTKDFLAFNHEFTINIALIVKKQVEFGLVYAPALKKMYYAQRGRGSFEIVNNEHIKLPYESCHGLVAGKSRFHDSRKNEEFLKINQINDVKSFGSSLKFGKLASGEISIYPRFVGSSEWDIAAGHLIVTESGCQIVDLKSFKEPVYNKPSIRNNNFIAHRGNIVFNDLILPEDNL